MGARVDAAVLTGEEWAQIAQRGFDSPEYFSAYLNTLQWNCATSTDASLLQSPFRAGIRLDAYQLEPLRKALRLSRVNLFIADDVGLGKTSEAGLIARELLMRKKVPDSSRPRHTPPAPRRLVRHVWPSPVGPPSSVVAAGRVHIHSNCSSIPKGGGHCFAAACIPSHDRLVACPLLTDFDQLLPFPTVACKARHLSGRYRAPSILPPPCVRSPPSSRHPMRIDRDPHRSLQCRASRSCTIDPAWHTAVSDSPSCSELGTPRIGARRGSLFARHGGT
jgi:hypothetical protein